MKRLFAFSILVISAAAFVQAQPKTTASPTPSKIDRTTKFDGNVEFPTVSGWTMSPKHVYPTPDLGYSVAYGSPQGGSVTVYVYRGGQKAIPNNLSGVVAAEMNQAKSDVQTLVDRGSYEYAKLQRSETIDLGGANGRVKALYAGYDLGVQGIDAVSEIYLFPYQDHFIKIRATRRKDLAKSDAFAKLLADLDLLFSK